jgi:hypothetical protein
MYRRKDARVLTNVYLPFGETAERTSRGVTVVGWKEEKRTLRAQQRFLPGRERERRTVRGPVPSVASGTEMQKSGRLRRQPPKQYG